MRYDTLLMACGARPMAPFAHAITFTGSISDQSRLHGIVQDVEGGYLHSVAFVVPSGRTWALPLYELAFMLAERAYTMGAHLDVHLVTPAAAPLEVFGPEAAREVADLLTEAGIRFHAGADAEVLGAGRLRLSPEGETLEVDRIITLPRLEGPAVPGLPYDSEGFLLIDAHARVRGVPDIYAAGDITDYPIKQGGIACQHADAAAAHIAASAGARVEADAVRTSAARDAAHRALGAFPAPRRRRGRDASPTTRCGGRRPRSPGASWPGACRRSMTRPAVTPSSPWPSAPVSRRSKC